MAMSILQTTVTLGSNAVMLSLGGKVLSFQIQGSQLSIFYCSDTTQPQQSKRTIFVIKNTGPILWPNVAVFIGTIQKGSDFYHAFAYDNS